jgi:hypothetical protein
MLNSVYKTFHFILGGNLGMNVLTSNPRNNKEPGMDSKSILPP